MQVTANGRCLTEVAIVHGFMSIGNEAMCIASCSINGDVELSALPGAQEVSGGSSARSTRVLRMQHSWRIGSTQQ